jgi:PhoPQ-activated pathogenicity-related protein
MPPISSQSETSKSFPLDAVRRLLWGSVVKSLSHRNSPALLVLLTAGLLSVAGPRASAGALENYVRLEDKSYSWKVLNTVQTNGFTVAHLELVSQTWRGHVWTHHLQIVRPEKVRNADIALLFVSGDGDGKKNLGMLGTLAKSAGAVAVIITRVPNQPLYDGRKEDALIAYTFDQYMKTGDETWPLLFPMAKSAVRGMDAVQEFAQKEHGQKISRFVVTGASKRGWTTWLSAAVDPRVAAIAPMVIDMLNMKAQLQWTEKMYGRQSEMIRDYTNIDLHLQQDAPGMVKLRAWVDPFSYRDRYTLPKLILLGTNDPYWTVDALRHYWNDLPGPKLIFQTPNAGHDLAGGKEAIPTLAAFFQMIADRQELPKFDWQIGGGDKSAKLTLQVNQTAKTIRLWTADSPDRDFRNDKWSSRELEIKPGSSKADAEIALPAAGYRAFLGEVELKTAAGLSYKLSTEARVTPDGLRQPQ